MPSRLTEGPLYCGVDAGTASVRAGIFDASGAMLSRAVCPVAVHDLPGRRAEAASTEIWQAAARAVREARAIADVPAAAVAGLAFDATCSLVLADTTGAPLALGPEGRDVILWYDHRATEEAALCTATAHPVLETLGGAMSPEMQTPKLLWLKRRRPDLWARLGGAWDLTDWLGHMATGQGARSRNTLAAKWAHVAPADAIPPDFLAALDLADMPARAGLGQGVIAPGARLGALRASAAEALDLAPGIPVAAGLVDAFAGALAMLGGLDTRARTRSAALVAGTSSCIMVIGDAHWRAKGVWGPYADAILPGRVVHEGGQSATGALLDDVLARCPGLDHVGAQALAEAGLAAEGPGFGGEIDVLPDVNGNRTPFADPDLGAIFCGITLDRSPEGTARLYWRAAVGSALGLRQIVEHLRAAGPPIEALYVTGGHARSALLMQLLADATGCDVRVAEGCDGVLLGAAIAAAAPGRDLAATAQAMQPSWRRFTPRAAAARRLALDNTVFLRLQSERAAIGALKRG
ncbi:Ribulokinase [Roseivivax jejudonensis]|uniref:Ribulokinase n=1 Tax=Roseivivax jejudonensis TaxID=1529041 RepID=A0A1X6YSD8_9RHOB|nr:FGGY-family carbohydrate kinase [Roseivivax jejudonensis]SLN29382.1 Ribulokinase [Roseivivax jejudonensis]